jgi:nucleotide-binding universal stress UspA family protein
MLRSILVGLDGSEHSDSALELGIRWARRFDALLVGIGVIDEPGLHGLEEYLVEESYFQGLNKTLLAETQRHVERSLGRYARRCAEAGVAFKELEDVGTPYVQILMEAQRYDLIVLGHHTHFQFGFGDEPDVTLSKVLAECPRPVVSVPDGRGDGEAVLIAYDGSLQAARALAAFESSGLGQGRKVHVLSVADSKKDSARWAERAVEFLGFHEVRAESMAVESSGSPVEVILESARMVDAGLLVMGAYGQPVLREFFLGSVTRSVLEKSPVPVFLYH